MSGFAPTNWIRNSKVGPATCVLTKPSDILKCNEVWLHVTLQLLLSLSRPWTTVRVFKLPPRLCPVYRVGNSRLTVVRKQITEFILVLLFITNYCTIYLYCNYKRLPIPAYPTLYWTIPHQCLFPSFFSIISKDKIQSLMLYVCVIYRQLGR